MSRARSAAQRAPQTKEAAIVLLERFAVASAAIAAIDADRQAELAKISATADALIVPLEAELKDIVKQLKPWWAANTDALTAGKRKSIELGGCLIGYRIGNPRVAYADGDDDAAVQALVTAELADQLVRVTRAPDKPAILRMLGGDDAQRLLDLGFSTKQTETFFVDPLTPAAPETTDAG